MSLLKTIFVFHLTVVCAVGASAAESPLVMENPQLLLLRRRDGRLDRPGRQACRR